MPSLREDNTIHFLYFILIWNLNFTIKLKNETENNGSIGEQKPKLTASEACHRLVPSEGLKENKRKGKESFRERMEEKRK